MEEQYESKRVVGGVVTSASSLERVGGLCRLGRILEGCFKMHVRYCVGQGWCAGVAACGKECMGMYKREMLHTFGKACGGQCKSERVHGNMQDVLHMSGKACGQLGLGKVPSLPYYSFLSPSLFFILTSFFE